MNNHILYRLRQAADKYRNDASALEEKNRQLNSTKNGILDDLAKKDKEMQQATIDIVRTKQMCRELEKKVADVMSELDKSRAERDLFKKKSEEKQIQRARSATLNSRDSISRSMSRRESADMMSTRKPKIGSLLTTFVKTNMTSILIFFRE